MGPEIFQSDSPGSLHSTSAFVRFIRNGAVQTRSASGLAFVPNRLPVRIEAAELVPIALDAGLAVGRLSGLGQDMVAARILSAPLMRREASLSSKIEDTIATPEEVALYEAGQLGASSDTVEVSNYRRALFHALQSPLPICMRLVREMHAILLENVRGEDRHPGEIRRIQNWIGGDPSSFASARFVPPPPETLAELLSNLEKFWNGEIGQLHPLIALGVAHYQFETIHPFGDGNGRLGRLLIVVSLVREGFLPAPLMYVSEHFERHRQRYYDLLLRVSTHGDWVSWIRFFLEGISIQATHSADRIERITQERRRVITILSEQNAPGRIHQLVDEFIIRPVMRASDVVRLLGVKDPTARSYIERLEALGFIRERTGGDYAKVWAATPILDIISGD